jgi:hypothetical protein
METYEIKRMGSPDETRSFDHGKVDLCTLGSHSVGRTHLEPGWRWSTAVKPIVGTESCQAAHVGYVVQGRLGVRMTDGSEFQLKAGDVYRVDPGHDAWVEGDEVFSGVEFETLKDYAKARS